MNLEIANLKVAFGGRVVAHVPELAIASGESVGVAGESGSGKSMTAMAILGLAQRLGADVAGSVKLDGHELVGASERELRAIRGRRIGMIFQSPSSAFNPVLRTGYTFRRVLALHGIESRRARRAAGKRSRRGTAAPARARPLPAPAFRRRAAAGGDRDGTRAARRAASRGRADERARRDCASGDLRNHLAHPGEREHGAPLISHDLAAVAEITERVVVMRAGEVVETGPTRKVVDAPAHPYTRALFDAVPVLGQRASSAQGL